jgi:hypothetical protein
MANATVTRPEWGDANKVREIFGISRTSLHRLTVAGKVKSSSLRERGQIKGKRLYSLDSVAAFLESRVIEPEAAPETREDV